MDLLTEIQYIAGPSGDEGRIADFVEARCARIEGAAVTRLGDLIVAAKGTPRVALFAHLDTIGFTLGCDRELIPIGGPRVEGGERLRDAVTGETARLKRSGLGAHASWRLAGKKGTPGSRWVFADPLTIKRGRVVGPYLDNRAGVWNALRVLEQVPDVLVFFTPGEEHSGRGALIGARLAFERFGVTQALISDITWHTASIKNGKGPAISLRDRYVPRQRYLEQVLAIAAESGVPFQREVESSGSSDGGWVERSTFPIDWVFIGAPQKRCHTPKEECVVEDLRQMVALYTYLVPALTAAG